MNPLYRSLFLALVVASPAWASQQVVETIDKSYSVDGAPEIDVQNVEGPNRHQRS